MNWKFDDANGDMGARLADGLRGRTRTPRLAKCETPVLAGVTGRKCSGRHANARVSKLRRDHPKIKQLSVKTPFFLHPPWRFHHPTQDLAAVGI